MNGRTNSDRRRRPPPRRNPALGHLSLPGLRAYRHQLGAEEGRVSYWRRVVQARLDIVRAGGPAALCPEALPEVLCRGQAAHPRRAFLAIVPLDDIPPLPDLDRLWATDVGAAGRASLVALEAALAEAEAQLSAYRAALHARLAEATAELVVRYSEDPTLSLIALPLEPPARARRGPRGEGGQSANGCERSPSREGRM